MVMLCHVTLRVDSDSISKGTLNVIKSVISLPIFHTSEVAYVI